MCAMPLPAEYPVSWPPPGLGKGCGSPTQSRGGVSACRHGWSLFSRGLPLHPPITTDFPMQAPGWLPPSSAPPSPVS